MITISNSDRDRAVECLRAYAATIPRDATTSTRLTNTRRLALNLAKKLERKRQTTIDNNR